MKRSRSCRTRTRQSTGGNRSWSSRWQATPSWFRSLKRQIAFFSKPSSPVARLRATLLRRSQTLSKLDPYELEILEAYETGKLKSIATKAELQRMHAAAGATAIKDKRVNIRLSTADLLDIQATALAPGMPYQTLIASILHKYVAGALAAKQPRGKRRRFSTTPQNCDPCAE